MKFELLSRLTARRFLGNPEKLPETWTNFSRMAWLEPIVISDGPHEYVLMSRVEFERLSGNQCQCP